MAVLSAGRRSRANGGAWLAALVVVCAVLWAGLAALGYLLWTWAT